MVAFLKNLTPFLSLKNLLRCSKFAPVVYQEVRHGDTPAVSDRPSSGTLTAQGLYNPCQRKDACGLGFVAHIKGTKAHNIVQQGLKILENLDHAARWAPTS